MPKQLSYLGSHHMLLNAGKDNDGSTQMLAVVEIDIGVFDPISQEYQTISFTAPLAEMANIVEKLHEALDVSLDQVLDDSEGEAKICIDPKEINDVKTNTNKGAFWQDHEITLGIN